MNFKSFKLSLFLIGTIIGAGFASGKEIATFFTRFGYLSLGLAVLSGYIFYLLCKMFLTAGNNLKENNFSDISKYLFKSKANYFDTALMFSLIVVVASMLAGSNAIGVIINNNYNSLIISLLTTILTTFVAFGGLKWLSKLNYIIAPIILLVLAVTCVLSFFLIKPDQAITFKMLEMSDYVMGIGSTITYVCLNMLLSGLILMQIGGNYNKREIKSSSLAFGIGIATLIILISLALILSNFGIFNSEMPIVALSLNISTSLGVGVSLIIYLAIFTTIVSTVYVTANYLKRYIKNYYICVPLCNAISFGVSILGFSNIVRFFYPVMGVLGLILVLSVIIKINNFNVFTKGIYKKNKKKIKEV